MHRTHHWLIAVALLWVAAPSISPALEVPDSAESRSAVAGGKPHARARLVIDSQGPSHFAGVLFDLDPGWHLYWAHPGDVGLAPRFEWNFVGGDARMGDIAWPTPKSFVEVEEDMVSYGYEGQVLLAAPIEVTTPPDSLQVTVDALVCSNQCIPAHFELERKFVTVSDRATRQVFEHAAARVPAAAAERGVAADFAWVRQADRMDVAELRVRECGPGCRPDSLTAMEFFPDASDNARIVSERNASGGRVALRIELTDAMPLQTLSGVLRFDTGSGTPQAVSIAVPIATAETAQAPGTGTTLWRALILGFLGGLILNLMPCVLPVLAIKVFAIAEMAHRSRKEVWVNAGAYTAGILTSLVALAAGVIALRWSGTAVGWGFQLQDPAFVAGISAVVVIFALNLFGVFEISVDTGRLGQVGLDASGAKRSFFDGLLAVTLATPCSAPFLGTAVGFAFASSALVIVSIFVAIGLGLAAPFVAVAMVPGWSNWMPKPGAWMVELRRGLGFALLATAIWLLSIIGHGAGVAAMTQILGLLLAISFATWAFGTLQRTRGTSSALLVTAVAVVLFGGLDRISLTPVEGGLESAAASDTQPYSPEAVNEALGRGQPAFVYFTADWCLTCKLNESRVLARPEVRKALHESNVAVFRADWTRRDEEIRVQLARLGKAGVPVYALYEPNQPDRPRVLSEILGVESFIQSVRETADAAKQHPPLAGSNLRAEPVTR